MSSKSSQSSSQSKSILSVQNIVLMSVAWGLIALFIFLFGSPIVPRPTWYTTSTYLLENLAFLAAGLLCFRNWKSSQIVSGRTVWLLIGLGMVFYFVANLLLWWWERSLGFAPDVSPADLFYLLSYFMLGLGMLMAVLSKQLNLSVLQWIVIASIAVVGVIVAYWVSGYAPLSDEDARLNPSPMAGTGVAVAWVQPADTSATAIFTSQAMAAKNMAHADMVMPESDWQGGAPTSIQPSIQPLIQLTQATESPADPAAEPTPEEASADPLANKPSWIAALNERLSPLADVVWILYLAGDTFLMVMATMLLLAFWGGRFSLSWRFIAAAGFSLYLADMWYYYAIDNIENYETGSLPEIFWIFSAVLFCIGAAVEYNLSTRSRRSRRRA